MADHGLNQLEITNYQRPNDMTIPPTVPCPGGPQFALIIDGEVSNKDISCTPWNRLNEELIKRAKRKDKQGAGHRVMGWCKSALRCVPNKKIRRDLFLGLAQSHTRSTCKDERCQSATTHHFTGKTKCDPTMDAAIRQHRNEHGKVARPCISCQNQQACV